MKSITRMELYNYMLRGKPHCPACNNTLAYIYGAASENTYITVKCNRCRNEILISTSDMETILISKAI